MKTLIQQINELMNRIEPQVQVIEVLPIQTYSEESSQEPGSMPAKRESSAEDLQFS